MIPVRTGRNNCTRYSLSGIEAREILYKLADLQGIANRCRGLKIEGNVWDFLADLEKTYYDTLKKRRLLDPIRLSKIVASNYPLSSDISKILIVATPNPEALPLEALKNLEADANIEVWINGPNENLSLIHI